MDLMPGRGVGFEHAAIARSWREPTLPTSKTLQGADADPARKLQAIREPLRVSGEASSLPPGGRWVSPRSRDVWRRLPFPKGLPKDAGGTQVAAA